MVGGCEVGSSVAAARFSAMLGRPVAPGDWVEEPPCLSRDELPRFAEAYGRECPRVDLEEPGLQAAAALAFALLHDSHLALAKLLARPLRSRRRLMALAEAVLSDERVAEAWREKREREREEARSRAKEA